MRVRVFSFVTSHPFRTRFRTPAIGKRQKGSESTERERKEEEKKKNGKGDRKSSLKAGLKALDFPSSRRIEKKLKRRFVRTNVGARYFAR